MSHFCEWTHCVTDRSDDKMLTLIFDLKMLAVLCADSRSLLGRVSAFEHNTKHQGSQFLVY